MDETVFIFRIKHTNTPTVSTTKDIEATSLEESNEGLHGREEMEEGGLA